MTALSIYSINDTGDGEENVIACLPEGKHVIGRGDLLQVSDKRVSRKHAVIEVEKEKITLTSVHVNPCFFRPTGGQTTIISEQQVLNDGDQFALLPENYWFRVKIKTGKRVYETNLENNNLNSDIKRARLTLNQPTTSYNHSHDTTHTNPEEHEIIMEANRDGLFSSLHFGEPETVDNNLEESKANNVVSKQGSSEDIKEEPQDYEENQQFQAVHTSQNTSVIQDNTKPVMKIENVDIYKDGASGSGSNEANQQSLRGNSSHNSSAIQDNAQPIIKTENNDDNRNDGAAENRPDGTSVPPGPQTGPRRERCWYGERCFRKNPNHRDSFSHPGDQDYESDPGDDRPECPYGMTCYRRNLDHRREYKHVARPAPKPRSPSPQALTNTQNSPPGSPSTQNSPPSGSPGTQNTPAKKKKPRRKVTTKKKPQDLDTPEDDYDVNDPFINDGSSDDYEPSDVSHGIDSSDSDWNDSQEVESQERKRMLREAKKFIKKKKED